MCLIQLHPCVFALQFYYLHPPGAFWEDEDEEDEFLASKPSKKCVKEGKKVAQCVEDKVSTGTTAAKKWGKSLDKLKNKAEKCAEKAEDDDAKLACASALFHGINEHCSVKDLEKACKASFEFEDFAFDLAEDEEPTTFATYLRG